MALGKIFQNNRKTEPTSVFSLRLIVTALFGIILVGYSIFLILDIRNDHPSIQTSFIETNSLPVPDVFFSTSSNEGLKNMGIMIYIDDATYNASDPSMSINIQAIDS
ncbi:13760_t:CDS:2, partial [Racocetra fulgida]